MSKKNHVTLGIEALESRVLLTTTPATSVILAQQSFDQTTVGTLPSGWSQWSSLGAFGGTASGFDGSPGMAVTGTSSVVARAWLNASQPANVQASASVFVNSVVPAQLLVRGRNLDTATPTYYALSVTRGVGVQLLRVVNGVSTTLKTVASASYLTNAWVQLSLIVTGSTLQAMVRRIDTGQFLNAAGAWQTNPVAALQVADTAIAGTGLVGIARGAGATGTLGFDDLGVRAINADGSGGAMLVAESFDSTPSGSLPPGWAQWSNNGAFQVSTERALSPNNSLYGATPAGVEARAWVNAAVPADATASAAVFVDSSNPAEVFLRGRGLNTDTANYYAVSVSRGLQVQLVRMTNGIPIVMAQMNSASYLSGLWVRVSLAASGTNLQAVVQRTDTGQYLNPAGLWQTARVSALNLNDNALTGPGQAGVVKPADYSGRVLFDDFKVSGAAAAAMAVSITAPPPNATISSPTNVQVVVSSGNPVSRVDFFIDGARQSNDSATPYTWLLDPALLSAGSHTLTATAYDSTGKSASASISVTTRNSTTVGGVTIPRHYRHIRIAELAYSGTPMDATAQQLLRNSVDLVVPNAAFLTEMNVLAPTTPQLIYTNMSSIYEKLLTDWLAFADDHGASREGAFYHVSHATAYSGASSSSMPVNWFWSVFQSDGTPDVIDMTSLARSPSSAAVTFGGVGTSMYIGYPDKFREINLSLASGARNGWGGLLEYATAVDADNQPTGWKPLPLRTDSTIGFARSGQITFDPPSDWKASSVGGSARLFFVRIRTVLDGTAPVANTILGRDFTNAHARSSGTIPAFDYAADKNHDGYLDDTEYAHRAAGKNARFVYESRLFMTGYGAMRPATNPSNAAFRSWAADFHVRLLKSTPLADGLFVDNSGGKAPALAGDVIESTSSYAVDYASMLNGVGRAIAPKWLMGNTSGGGTNADPFIQQNTAYFEEFLLRPLAQNWQQFEDLAQNLAHRANLRTPQPYAVLDSLPTGGSPTDPRTQLATLAQYYLLADPNSTFLDFYGGYSPSSSWSQHWSRAAAYDVGTPTSGWSLFATNVDPGNHALTYRIYQRQYSNALVLYKPLSYNVAASAPGLLGSSSATTHRLPGTYRPLRADGSLGSPTTSVSLRNGEGAILIKV
jgi:Bacterial Ig domain